MCFPSVHTVQKKVAFIQRVDGQILNTTGLYALIGNPIIFANLTSDNNYFVFSVPKRWPYQRKRLGKRVGGRIQLAFMYQRGIPQYPTTFTGSNHSQKRTLGPSWQTSQIKTPSQSQPILSSTKKWGFHRCLQPPEAGLWQKVKGM